LFLPGLETRGTLPKLKYNGGPCLVEISRRTGERTMGFWLCTCCARGAVSTQLPSEDPAAAQETCMPETDKVPDERDLPDPGVGKFEPGLITFGTCERQGRRENMEDRSVIVHNLGVDGFYEEDGLYPQIFLGVYDGHGGSE
ncbi:unnamed protein product, partial [Discosporangium mesarthrocarpum]